MAMRILIVDDSRHVRTQLKLLLKSGGYTNLVFAETATEAFSYLGIESPEKNDAPPIDLILMDIIMPDIDGINSCRIIKTVEFVRDVPIIMVTGDTSEESLQHAFEAGAMDYITKPLRKVELLARVGAALRLKQETDARKARELELLKATMQLERANQQLEESIRMLERMASVDGLTGVANRRYFDEMLAKEWRRAIRLSQRLSVILIDVDFFKNYNDTYGHLQGDECLKQVARALTVPLKRPLDIVARYGGEEFVLVLPGCEGPEALTVAQKIGKAVEDAGIPHDKIQATGVVTVSAGVAFCSPATDQNPEDLLKKADAALYKAKANGRNNSVLAG